MNDRKPVKRRWEYMRYPHIPELCGPNLVALDQLGAEGWELVCYVPDREVCNGATGAAGGYLLFKREVPDAKP